MSTATVTPVRADVTVILPLDPPALDIIDRVVATLEAAGYDDVADAFLYDARSCATDADVLRLAHRTVDVI